MPFCAFIGQSASTSVAAAPFVAHMSCAGCSAARDTRQQSYLAGSTRLAAAACDPKISWLSSSSAPLLGATALVAEPVSVPSK